MQQLITWQSAKWDLCFDVGRREFVLVLLKEFEEVVEVDRWSFDKMGKLSEVQGWVSRMALMLAGGMGRDRFRRMYDNFIFKVLGEDREIQMKEGIYFGAVSEEEE